MRRLIQILVVLGAMSSEALGESELPNDWPVVQTWLTALAARDLAHLRELTSLPFSFRSLTPGNTCQPQLQAATELENWAQCVHLQEQKLFSQVRFGGDVLYKEGGWGESPRFRRLSEGISESGIWVEAYLQVYRPRTTITYVFRFLRKSGQGKVAALLIGEYSASSPRK
jgi:hypothetical protein